MQVISQNVERGLSLVLKKHWYDKTCYRCAHIKTSLLSCDEEQKGGIIASLVEVARQSFDDPLGMIFKCHDGDIFIVARFLTFKQIDQFVKNFTKSRKDLDDKARIFLDEKAAFLYEIAVEWPKLKAICDYKIQSYLDVKSEIRKEDAAQESFRNQQRVLRMDIESSLIETLAQRREDRQHVEVLVVEDDMFTQKLVKNAIAGKYDLSMAQDGFGAVMMYAKKAPDILFLDIGLPDVSGHAVLKKIFDIDPDAYVVMLSGNGDRDNVMKAIDRGARGFVGKPFTKDKLLQYIGKSSFVQKKRKKQEDIHAHIIN